MTELKYLYGKPLAEAVFKAEPEDFIVNEILGFEPEPNAAGQHHWLYIQKTGMNTEFLARKLADFANVQPREVSFSGLKDRHAVTQQWFSVELPAKTEVNWSHFEEPGALILKQVRSGRKLRRGTHQANEFSILLRSVTEPDLVNQRLSLIAQGVPNYFGPQRFGHEGRNIDKAKAMFAGRRVKDRNLRSLLLSAARSWLFNQIVDARLAAFGLEPVAGDAMQLQGSHSFFLADTIDDTVRARLAEGDIAITAPLPGRKKKARDEIERSEKASEAERFEASVLEPYQAWLDGLIRAGVEQHRRTLMLRPVDFEWNWEGEHLRLHFRLEAGAFATSVLRELVQLKESSGAHFIE
ncbi:tRNA pseudouridine(13) synthase TruD [Aliidiomarina celeris]|uniref:tRNA pseudouridine(13) synthase TruD n=1 Tax=Aliidiomarina celeris TaxID=2249428 RepID=UPI000DEBF191|nr:tRNA pseudouridine(13) synthase TruD [Aliidiomarina celeris]